MDTSIKKIIDYTNKGYSIIIRPHDNRDSIDISVRKGNHAISYTMSHQEVMLDTVEPSIFAIIDRLISDFEYQMSKQGEGSNDKRKRIE